MHDKPFTGSSGTDDSIAAPKPRRIIRILDSRFVVPDDIEPVRILFIAQVANNHGGTGFHYEYHVLAEEVETNG